jgi:hypothetical protein
MYAVVVLYDKVAICLHPQHLNRTDSIDSIA